MDRVAQPGHTSSSRLEADSRLSPAWPAESLAPVLRALAARTLLAPAAQLVFASPLPAAVPRALRPARLARPGASRVSVSAARASACWPVGALVCPARERPAPAALGRAFALRRPASPRSAKLPRATSPLRRRELETSRQSAFAPGFGAAAPAAGVAPGLGG